MKNHQKNLVVGVLEQSLELRTLFNIFSALQPRLECFPSLRTQALGSKAQYDNSPYRNNYKKI